MLQKLSDAAKVLKQRDITRAGPVYFLASSILEEKLHEMLHEIGIGDGVDGVNSSFRYFGEVTEAFLNRRPELTVDLHQDRSHKETLRRTNAYVFTASGRHQGVVTARYTGYTPEYKKSVAEKGESIHEALKRLAMLNDATVILYCTWYHPSQWFESTMIDIEVAWYQPTHS